MNDALQWATENASLLNIFVNFGLLLVWAVYLNLILNSFRRARRCKIMVNVGGHTGIRARCLISNMSAEPIYVVRVNATVSSNEEDFSSTVSEYRVDSEEGPEDAQQVTGQGPLLTGGWRDVGSLSGLITETLQNNADDRSIYELAPLRVELFVIALYGSEDLPVGARRTFSVTRKGEGWGVHPEVPDVEQIRGRRDRRELYNYL